jgi:hypothetical protein
MKHSVKRILFLALIVIVWSCNELPKKGSDSEKKVAKTEKKAKKNAKKELLEQLKNTKPVDVADLEAWIPKTLGGLSHERTKSLGMYGEDVAMMGWYKRKEDKIIILYIYDAAGPDGTMISNKINVLGTERESDVETQQHRSVNVKGRMARQIYETKANMTTISFFHKKRFMIMITAHDHSVEETWNLVDELDFMALDDLAKQ